LHHSHSYSHHLHSPHFFFTSTPTTAIYPLSLHDALPICVFFPLHRFHGGSSEVFHRVLSRVSQWFKQTLGDQDRDFVLRKDQARSEEHTSELQSRGHLVCRLLLEKKKHRGIDQLERVKDN